MAVAGLGAAAADDEVADAGEAGERLRPRTRRLAEPRHLGQPAGDERGLRVVAEPEAVDAAGRERDHVLRRGAQLDPDEIRIDVRAEEARVERVLKLAREEAVLARDHGRRRQALRDLLRDVRAGENGDRTAADAGREPLAGLRVETLDEAQDRRVARQHADHVGERLARHRDRDDVDVAGGVGQTEPPRLRGGRRSAGSAGSSRCRDRLGLLRRATGEHDLVAALEQDTRERRPPGPRADHEKPHRQDRLTKSIETGTPSRPKRSRSRFSTQ